MCYPKHCLFQLNQNDNKTPWNTNSSPNDLQSKDEKKSICSNSYGILAKFFSSLSSFIVTSTNSYYITTAVLYQVSHQASLPASEKTYILNWLCDANIKSTSLQKNALWKMFLGHTCHSHQLVCPCQPSEGTLRRSLFVVSLLSAVCNLPSQLTYIYHVL